MAELESSTPKQRRSLSNIGGPSVFRGDRALERVLTEAFAPPEDADERLVTHAFHPWPGRLHPHIAQALIALAPDGVIADPFMGAGTVPLEALRAGRRAIGNDLNPIGAEVAWVRTRRMSPAATRALVARGKAVWKVAEGLNAGAPVGGGEADWARIQELKRWFDAQALGEVLALARALGQARPEWPGSPGDPLTRMLRMVLSSLLVKASRQVSDSVARIDRRPPQATPPGRVGHWFKKRVAELAEQLDALGAAVGREAPEPEFLFGDARLGAPEGVQIGAIVTSPPYPGVYDYYTHHQLRCWVLGLPLGPVAEREIGGRQASERVGAQAAMSSYVDDLTRVLRGWGRGLVPGGFAALVVGDGEIKRGVIRVLPLVARAAHGAGFGVRAVVSQARPSFGGGEGGAPKEEHLVWLERGVATPEDIGRGGRRVG